MATLISPATATRTESFATDAPHKRLIRSCGPSRLRRHRPLILHVRPAIRLLESGFSTARAVDTGVFDACSHPMGPT